MKKIILYALFFINLAIILAFWWVSSGILMRLGVSFALLALGRAAGLLAVYFILLQFVLRGRAVWIEEVFGLNNLSTAHRLNGYFSLLFITIHPTLLTIAYSLQGQTNIISQFLDFLINYQDVFWAFIAALLFIGIVFVSIYIIRKKLKYEVWYYIHLLTYLAVLLAFLHQLKVGTDFQGNKPFILYWYLLYGAVFANLLFFRFLRQIYLFAKYRFVVEKIIPETENATSVYIGGNSINKFKIQPGQFLIVRFLSKKFLWQVHPFSLSWVPKKNQLRLTIKHAGDFTSQVPAIKPQTPVLIDGPLGTFTADNAKKEAYLFIAGGVGITPIRSLIEELAPKQKNIILLYSNRTANNIIFKKELDELAKTYGFPIHYFITQDRKHTMRQGRLGEEKIRELVPDFRERDIYLCGPTGMMEHVIMQLKKAGVSNDQLHYEKFAL